MKDHDKQSGSAIEVSPAAVATIEQPTTERPGQKIGRYKLLEQIGEGGMGTVWVAEQSEPVKRRVALKLVKAGMDTRQVLSRFEAERQALALMDHPNIAKVHDGGMTEAGRPFFVMEFVKGVPITDYCDSVRLPIRERLKLFIPVCQAVQHAHQKGIIHRDLKPSNILVCLYDGQPVPKLLDFGLAKAVSQPLTEHTLYTAQGMMVGTPLYMSPEQAEFNNFDVDTRTDIYSLGVILYELLTGVTPLEKQQFKNAAFQEILRLIKEVEPQKPSTRLSALSNRQTPSAVAENDGTRSVPTTSKLDAIAAQRGLEPAQLSRLIRGDLDWIVMKSLEKERSRRYEAANGLARDIERYLHDEPVEASPPSASYRFRKLAKKHRGLLTTAAAFIALLVSGTAFSAWQAVRATRAEQIAKKNNEEFARFAEQRALESSMGADQAKQTAQSAAAAERKAKDAALQRDRETKAVLSFVEDKILAAARPEGQKGGLGHDVTLRKAIEGAIPFIEENFKDQPLIEARLRMTVGRSFRDLGEPLAAAEQIEAARALYEAQRGSKHLDTLTSMNLLAYPYTQLGRHQDALKLRRETLALCQVTLSRDHRLTLDCMHGLTNNLNALKLYEEAMNVGKETLERCTAVLGPSDSQTLWSMNNLAISYRGLRRYPEAFDLNERTLSLRRSELGPDHPDTLTSMFNLARSHSDLGNDEPAAAIQRETLELRRAKIGSDHPDTLRSMLDLATTLTKLGRNAEAFKLSEETLILRKAKLGSGHPQTLWTMWRVIENLVKLDRGDEAIPIIDDVLHRATGNAVDPRMIPDILYIRLYHFQKVADPEGCKATAELWEKRIQDDPISPYNAACARAVTAAVIRTADPSDSAAKDATAEADRAMDWLQKAIAAGFKDAADIAKDKDLDSLRDRDDFQRLLAALEAGQKKEPK